MTTEMRTVSTMGTDNGLLASAEQFCRLCEARWPADQPPAAVITRSPGRLDCMGGMADYSGTLALQIPIAQAAMVAAGRREDQNIRVMSVDWEQAGTNAVAEWPLAAFYQSDGQFRTGPEFARRFDACPWVRGVAGVCLALLESGELPHFAGGMTLMIHSDIPSNASLASSAAIEVATAMAVTALFGVELPAPRLVAVCREAATETGLALPGLVDHLTCLHGEAGALLQIRSQPDDVLGTLSLPPGLLLAAVEIGQRQPIYRERYLDNRTAALMGRHIIDAVARTEDADADYTGGYIANVSPSEFVRRFRNELPVKMRGRDFLERFSPGDAIDGVDPDRIYKIRSRTEHHIYENDRAHRLMERLARVRRTGERDALVEASELMYASHWSYGQRCGMSSIEADILVGLIREAGSARGFFGAKVTGGGCGGTLAVFLADTPAAREALDAACAAYTQKTGFHPTVLTGSSPGALAFGHRCLE